MSRSSSCKIHPAATHLCFPAGRVKLRIADNVIVPPDSCVTFHTICKLAATYSNHSPYFYRTPTKLKEGNVSAVCPSFCSQGGLLYRALTWSPVQGCTPTVQDPAPPPTCSNLFIYLGSHCTGTITQQHVQTYSLCSLYCRQCGRLTFD